MTYLAVLIQTIALLLGVGDSPPTYKASGYATTFHPTGPWNNGKLACGGDWNDPSRPLCAHRTLPCGTWVHLVNKKNNRTAWCQILDRGPYGALTPEGKWVLKRPRDKHIEADYRSLIDLSPAVAKALGTKGRGSVIVRSWHKRKSRRKRRASSGN